MTAPFKVTETTRPSTYQRLRCDRIGSRGLLVIRDNRTAIPITAARRVNGFNEQLDGSHAILTIRSLSDLGRLPEGKPQTLRVSCSRRPPSRVNQCDKA